MIQYRFSSEFGGQH